MKLPIAIASLSGLLLAGPAPAAQSKCRVTSAELPVTMSGMRALVLTKINGADATFVADSGAFFSMITPAAAAQYQLPLHRAPSRLRVRGVGGLAEVSVAKVAAFIAGYVLAV